LNFLKKIFEKYSNIKFHEIRPVKSDFFRAHRRTDMKLTVAIRSVSKLSFKML